MEGLTLTPDVGLAVQPSSAVAVLVSINVSVDQKEKIWLEGLLDSGLYVHEVTYEHNVSARSLGPLCEAEKRRGLPGPCSS